MIFPHLSHVIGPNQGRDYPIIFIGPAHTPGEGITYSCSLSPSYLLLSLCLPFHHLQLLLRLPLFQSFSTRVPVYLEDTVGGQSQSHLLLFLIECSHCSGVSTLLYIATFFRKHCSQLLYRRGKSSWWFHLPHQ